MSTIANYVGGSPTPRILRICFAVIIAAALLLWSVAASNLAAARHTVQTIGKDTVPSIVAAEEIRANLADANANAANASLSSGDAAKQAWEKYEKDLSTAADRLVTAAQNIAYGEQDRVPILTMVIQIRSYAEMVATARARGFPEGAAILRPASKLMHDTILPAADALDQANFIHLKREYAQSRSDGAFALGTILASAVLLFAALVHTQLLLTRRFHRYINIPLATASLLLVGFTAWLAIGVLTVQHQLKTAKEDAFDSIHALWRARALAFDVRGDESLYLMDGGSDEFEKSFRQKSALLASTPITENTLKEAFLNGTMPIVGVGGLLGDELRNITFSGEREAATAMVDWYRRYMEIDAKIRSAQKAGNHAKALQLCIGNYEGDSNWAFAQFDKSLGETLDINQREFDAAVKEAFAALDWLPIMAPITAALIVFLSWHGLQARIDEYRV